MDIRTKLAFALVLFSLISMALLGVFAYQESTRLLAEISHRQLGALAESKRNDLVKVQDGWRDKVLLISSQHEFAEAVRRYLADPTEENLIPVTDLVDNAAAVVRAVDRISVFSLTGEEIESSGRAPMGDSPPAPVPEGAVAYRGTLVSDTGIIRVAFATMLIQDTVPTGVMEVVFAIDDVSAVAGNYTGLGDGGEAYVVARTGPDMVTVLNSLRHLGETGPVTIPISESTEPVHHLMQGAEGLLERPFVDYRGESSWAATRLISELDWGLVVKVDEQEESERADALRDALFDIGIALSAFAIIGGTLIGVYLARPIHELRLVVERVRSGDTMARAEVKGDDEITYLASSLNDLIDNWQPKSSTDAPTAEPTDRTPDD